MSRVDSKHQDRADDAGRVHIILGDQRADRLTNSLLHRAGKLRIKWGAAWRVPISSIDGHALDCSSKRRMSVDVYGVMSNDSGRCNDGRDGVRT